MAAVIQLPQTSFWAKRKKQPPVRQPNDASRSHEYLTPDEVEHMITAARRNHDRLAEHDAPAHHNGLSARLPSSLLWRYRLESALPFALLLSRFLVVPEVARATSYPRSSCSRPLRLTSVDVRPCDSSHRSKF